MTFRETLRRSDPLLAGGALILSFLSLILLATGTEDRLSNTFVVRQSVSLAIGVALFFVAAKTHYSFVRSFASPLYLFLIGFLVVVLQQQAIRGAASWIVVGALRVQPGEIAKMVLVIVLAKVLSAHQKETLPFRTFLLALVYGALPIGLILVQPDFGTAALLVFLWIGMVATAGMNRRQFAALCIAGAIAGTLGWSLFLQDYQKERLQVFLQPGSDPLGSGYTVLQSVTALGSGGLWGRGLGHGPQSRLNFLPEHRTDFIFARIGEELGFVGVAGVLLLYSLMLFRILQAAERTSDTFGKILVIGVFVTLLVGVVVNAGMNIGILPVTGVPLPLVSYGGNSLVTMFLLLGIVQSVRIHGERWEAAEREETFGVSSPLVHTPRRMRGLTHSAGLPSSRR